MGGLLAGFRKNRTKIWVGAVTLLLVFYLVVSFQRSILLLTDSNLAAQAIGAAYLVLPVIGAWAEAAPDDWRSWFRLSCAYDAAGDRKRARASMRDAVRLFQGNAPA